MASDGDDQSAVLEVTSHTKKVNTNFANKIDSSNSNNSSIYEDNDNLISPSAESISTFQELNRTTDLILENNVDIVARVDEPLKVVEPWGTYVTFRIRTKTRRWDNNEKEYTVHRRYNDFKALRERLVEASFQVIPPLPSRHTLLAQLDRYSKDFVLERMALLNIFIKRLVSHSILTHNEDLKIFLTASSSEFNNHFKSKTSYLTSISDSLYSLASPNGGPSLTANTCRIKDPEFSAIADYMTNLHEKLEYFNTISSRITKERVDISTEMKLIGPMLENWCQTERFNRDTLKKIPPKVSENKNQASDSFPLGNTLKKMNKPFCFVASEHLKLINIITNPVKEYILYIEAVKDKLFWRDSLQANLEAANKKKDKATNGIANSQQINSQCHDRLQCASEALRSDICGWQRQKKTDLKMLLIEMAKKHIEFYEKSLTSWETVLGSPSNTKFITNINTSNNPDLLNQMASALSLESPYSHNDYQDNCSYRSGERSKESSDWENVG